MARVQFLLGTHQPGWLERVGVSLFVSDTRLRAYKTLPRANRRWAEDSGGFTELQRFGAWTVSPRDYVARVRRYRDEIGQLLWAAPQDWMCEPLIINGGWANGRRFVGTHLSVEEHQRRTVLNYLELRDLAADLNIIPVVQGDGPDSHRRCADLYWTLARIDLTEYPLVGVGSVCRLQATSIAGRILTALNRHGLKRLHGFGFKTMGLVSHGHLLTSADSLAWSDNARKHARRAERLGLPHALMPGCVPSPSHPAKNCANCRPYALRWRDHVRAAAHTPRYIQGDLFDD